VGHGVGSCSSWCCCGRVARQGACAPAAAAEIHCCWCAVACCRSAEDAADATLRFHFRRRTLKTYVSACNHTHYCVLVAWQRNAGVMSARHMSLACNTRVCSSPCHLVGKLAVAQGLRNEPHYSDCSALLGAALQVPHWAARRQDLLRREYLTAADGPAQPQHGFKGQVAACWRHSLSNREATAIAAGAWCLVCCLVLLVWCCHCATMRCACAVRLWCTVQT
jgi:hypothetical protein